MRKLMMLAAMLPAVAGAAEDWWVKSDATLPSLVADGFEIVGFTTVQEDSPMPAFALGFRYLLKKEAAVYLCTEKFSTKLIMAQCYVLKPPAPTQP